MTERRVPFHRPALGDSEKEALLEVVASGWLTSGPKVEEFERRCADFLGRKNVLALSSCTAGLEIALLAMGIGPGDEVITTPLTFVATVASIWRTGATPILVDVDPTTGILETEAVAAAITPRTKAILPVHLAGYPAPMKELLAIAARSHVPIIDDAAHAFETTSDAGKIGAVGACTAFSFYANKNLTTGEGGLLTMADNGLFKRAKSLRLHGIDRDAWQRKDGEGFRFYDVAEVGLKANMSDLSAAMGIEQLDRLPAMTARRLAIQERYNSGFAEIASLSLPSPPSVGEHAWHVYAVQFVEGDAPRRDAFIDALFARGVGTSIHFKPVHLLTGPSKRIALTRGAFPCAELFYDTHVSLPIYPAMTDEDIDYVIKAVTEILS